MQRVIPGISALRDVSIAQLQSFGTGLSATVQKRCRHVISEDARVQDAAQALKSADLKRFGARMYESHLSLRNDYEVSCEELDRMVEIARSVDGVFGARMTGGGFGGCTVNLVRAGAVGPFTERMTREYQAATSIAPGICVCSPVAGAGRIRQDAGI